MKKYVILEDNLIQNVVVLSDSDVAPENYLEVNETNMPQILLASNANDFFPQGEQEQGNLTQLQLLAKKADVYFSAGSDMYNRSETGVKAMVWAVNSQLALMQIPLTYEQMVQLLQLSMLLKEAFESGSFITAKAIIANVKVNYPLYSNLCDQFTQEIDAFLATQV